MKNKIVLLPFLVVLISVLGLGVVSAIDISVDNYYPAPVEAGEYLNVWLKITNRESADVEKAVVKVKPSFPFSLDPGEPEEIIIDKIEAGGFVIEKIKIRVDAGANEGDNNLAFQYADGVSSPWKEKSIPITVVESKTTFDVVLQEINEEGIFIAIANIGKNPANAVTIRIPEQEYFQTKLVSASVVGNLESGDYTLVGFQITPKSGVQTGITSGEKSQTTGQQINLQEEKQLQVQIDYTDPLGIRRTIFKEISLNPASLSMATGTDLSGITGTGRLNSNGSGSTTFLSDTWFWVSIVLLAIMAAQIVHRKVKRKREQRLK